MKLYTFRTVRLSIIRSLFTVHSAMVYHTGLKEAFEQDQDGTAVPSWFCSKAVYKPVWYIPLLSVQWINSWWWIDELSETCRVSWQNKFVKLVHLPLVGFITKKYHFQFLKISKDETSERQTAHVGATLAHLTFKSCYYIREWLLGKIYNLFL